MTMPSDFTNENVRSWLLRILADYDGRFILDGDTFAKEAIWIRGPGARSWCRGKRGTTTVPA